MHKRLLIIIICSFLAVVSCRTTANAEQNSAIYEERAEKAISRLSEDISIYSEYSALDGEDIEYFLPSSYIIYKDYSPVYSEIKNKYIENILAILEKKNEDLDNLFLSYAGELLSSASVLIDSDTALVDRVRVDHFNDFYSYLRSYMENSEELKAAFNVSYNSFSAIRDAYARLKDIGQEVSLPIPESISIAKLSNSYITAYLARLSKYERQIKNTRIDYSDDSAYSIFWEE